jgi:hypothetical protein
MWNRDPVGGEGGGGVVAMRRSSSQPQTRPERDMCTGPTFETQKKAVNVSRREGADQLL